MTTQRANRITVQANDQNGFTAKFHRTHKFIAEVQSQDTTFVPPAGLNKTAERELFRVWVCDNSTIFGVEWDPTDRRTETNIMPAKYPTEELLVASARNLVSPDVNEWVGKLKEAFPSLSVELQCIESVPEEVEPVHSYKEREVAPRYGNGNWAYAKIPVLVTVRVSKPNPNGRGIAQTDGYVTMICSLVSGQMKKPTAIGGAGYTYTSFKSELMKDIPDFEEAIKAAEEAKKAEKSAKVDTPKVEADAKVETPASEETGTTSKSGKGKNKDKAEAVEA